MEHASHVLSPTVNLAASRALVYVQLAMTRMLLIALEHVSCPVIVFFAQLAPQLVGQPPMECVLPVFQVILLSVQLALQKIA